MWKSEIRDCEIGRFHNLTGDFTISRSNPVVTDDPAFTHFAACAPETQALAFHRLLTGEGTAEIYRKGKLQHELVGRSQPGNGGGMIRLCHGEPMVNPNIPDRQTTRVVEGVDDLEETAVMAGRTRNQVTARRAGIEPRTFLAGPSA